MPYEFLAGTSVAENIRRLAAEQIDHALYCLGNKRYGDAGIHEARKSCKKLRALVRLVRSEFGHTYTHENRAFRDIARSLSSARDTAVARSTVETLNERNLPVSTTEALHSVLAALEHHGNSHSAHHDRIDHARAEFAAARECVHDWPSPDDTFTSLADGLRSVYRQGKKLFAAARPAPGHMHELRKQIKYLWYHNRLLRPVWPRLMNVYTGTLSQLSDILGDYHDLDVLCNILHTDPERCGGSEAAARVAELAVARRGWLYPKVLSMCSLVYAERPGCYVRRMGRYWHSWASVPK